MSAIIYSMTGVGVGSESNGEFEVSVKVQSVNSRYLDLNIRMPSAYNQFETRLRELVRNYVTRGKVDVFIEIRDLRDDAIKPVLNDSIVRAYLSAVESLPEHAKLDTTVTATSLLSYPQALRMEASEIADEEAFVSHLCAVLKTAVEEFVENRAVEGERMLNDMRSRMETCKQCLDNIESNVDLIKSEYLQKMRDRIAELIDLETLDEGRLEQEVAYLLDKSDITEELVRFRSHMTRFEEILAGDGEKGKKLDFLLQEFGRETNTIGSKSRNIEISRYVVDIKSELEKIREQVQNIE